MNKVCQHNWFSNIKINQHTSRRPSTAIQSKWSSSCSWQDDRLYVQVQ